MIVWHAGALDAVPADMPADRTLAWHVRLDDPAIEALAQRARLSAADLRDLAGRPDAAMRARRRQLTKVALARLSGTHPDRVAVSRSAAGAPGVVSPDGWHVSVAGRWPYALIGLGRAPLGVDLEPLGALPPPDEALTAAERAAVAGDARAALLRWAMKEAHAKRLGIARQIAPDAIETLVAPGRALAWCAAGRSRCWIDRRDGRLAVVALG